MIYFTRYHPDKSRTLLNLYYDELIRKIEDYEGKKSSMIDDYMLDLVLDKIKKIISIEKFDNTKILIDTDDKLLDDITLKNSVILTTCVIKDCDKFYSQLFL